MCFVLIFLNCIFHWGVTALQYSVGFCCISAWISHGYTYVPWRRKWQPTPVFLPGESREQWTLAGYSLWGGRVGHDLATKPYMCPLPLESPSHPSRLSQSISFGSLCHITNSHWLLCYIWHCICFNATLSNHLTFSLSNYVQKSVLYVCISIAVLYPYHLLKTIFWEKGSTISVKRMNVLGAIMNLS